MKIRNDTVVIEASGEEIEALHAVLKGPNSAAEWDLKGCTGKQIDLVCNIFDCLRNYLRK